MTSGDERKCEGECIVIHDDSGNVYKSVYK